MNRLRESDGQDLVLGMDGGEVAAEVHAVSTRCHVEGLRGVGIGAAEQVVCGLDRLNPGYHRSR